MVINPSPFFFSHLMHFVSISSLPQLSHYIFCSFLTLMLGYHRLLHNVDSTPSYQLHLPFLSQLLLGHKLPMMMLALMDHQLSNLDSLAIEPLQRHGEVVSDF